MKHSLRTLYASLFLFSLFSIGLSFVLQFVFDLVPCPLCVIDRIIMCLMMILFGIGWLLAWKGSPQKIYSLIGFGLGLLGCGVGIRHLWIIHHPSSEMPACSPGLAYLFDTLPLLEAIQVLFHGSGDCVYQSTFLGLSIPGWTLIAFLILTLGCLLPWFEKR